MIEVPQTPRHFLNAVAILLVLIVLGGIFLYARITDVATAQEQSRNDFLADNSTMRVERMAVLSDFEYRIRQRFQERFDALEKRVIELERKLQPTPDGRSGVPPT